MAEFITAFRQMASKLETTPGTAETLTSQDNDVRAWDLQVGALDQPMDEDPSKYANGDFSLGESVPGPSSAKISFRTKWAADTDNATSAAAGDEPRWTKFFKAASCETSAVVNEGWGTGFAIYPDAASAEDTMTIGVYEKERGSSPKALFFSFAGAIGSPSLTVEGTGKPYNVAWEFTGGLSDISDLAVSAIPTLSAGLVSSEIPDTFQNGVVTIGSYSACVSTLEFTLGNTVSPVECVGAATGYEKWGIVEQAPMLTINPTLTRNSNYDFWGNLTTGTIESVLVDTERFRLYIPRAQIMTASIEDADGIVRTPLSLRPLRPSTEGAFNYASWVMYVKNFNVAID